MIYKIIMQSGDIPINSDVTKIKGEKIYKLVKEVKIYKLDQTMDIIKSDTNSRFIISDNGSLNAIGINTELVWLAKKEELLKYIEDDDGYW